MAILSCVSYGVLLALISCLFINTVQTSPSPQKRETATSYKLRFRVSPIDGSKIALPTQEQLAWQDKEIGMLIHFNIATFISSDGCNDQPSLLPNASIFNPSLINTDQWVDTIEAVGAKYATLVVKHNCGFTTWPTHVTFPTMNGPTIAYNYSVTQSPMDGFDIVKSFVDSCHAHDIGTGFYYSVVVNNFLNVQFSEVINTVWVPGQANVTNSTYDRIVLDQLTELWSDYGKLEEIWFDGGYSSTQTTNITHLLHKLQPQAAIFNGCTTNGTCVSANSVRWIGTELGEAPDPTWSTGVSNDGGDPTSPYFCPAECNTTLQTGDRWFFGVNHTLRSIEDMINVYHKTVGRNCVLELDLTPDRSGLIPANYAARYKQLGDFIKSCYGTSIPHKNVTTKAGLYTMEFDYPTSIDRIMLMEDQTNGQVIRSYNVHAKIVDSKDTNGTLNTPWTLISNGTSIGHKKIDLFKQPITVTGVMVNTTYVDTPVWRSVSVYLCDRLSTNETITE